MMTDLVATELIARWTLKLPRVALVLAGVLAGLVSYAAVSVATGTSEGDIVLADLSLAMLVQGPFQALGFLAVLVAVTAGAGTWQHGTIRTTLLAEPRRARVLAGGVIAAALYGVALAVVSVVVSLGTGALLLRDAGLAVGWADWSTWRAALGVVLLIALWSVIGAGLGTLLANTAAAMVGLLLWYFVGEGVLPVLLEEPGLPRWLPSGAAQAVLEGGTGTRDLLEPLPGALLLAGYAVVIAVLGALAMLRREPR